MPDSKPRGTYRDELATAYARIADLEARNHALEAALADNTPAVHTEHVRDLDATLRRWDYVRATLALVLGFTGLFALVVAERWDVRTALLATCCAMVAVGITLAWPKIVRAQVDPRPHARDVSFPWRRARRAKRAAATEKALGDGVRVDASAAAAPGHGASGGDGQREWHEAAAPLSPEEATRSARPR